MGMLLMPGNPDVRRQDAVRINISGKKPAVNLF